MADAWETKLLQALGRLASVIEKSVGSSAVTHGLGSPLGSPYVWQKVQELLTAGADLAADVDDDGGDGSPPSLPAGEALSGTPTMHVDRRRMREIAARACATAVQAMSTGVHGRVPPRETTNHPHDVSSTIFNPETVFAPLVSDLGSVRPIQIDGSMIHTDQEPNHVSAKSHDAPWPCQQSRESPNNSPKDQGADQPSESGAIDFDLATAEMGPDLIKSLNEKLRLDAHRERFDSDGFIKVKISDLPNVDIKALMMRATEPEDEQIQTVASKGQKHPERGFVVIETNHGLHTKDQFLAFPQEPSSDDATKESSKCFDDFIKAPAAPYWYYAGPPLVGHEPDDGEDDQGINSLLDPGSALRHLHKIEGVNTVYWLLGDRGSVTAMHEEDVGLSSANLVLAGRKDWLIVSPRDRLKVERLVRRLRIGKTEAFACSQAIRHLNVILSPDLLSREGISFIVASCGPAEMIVTAPRALHQVYNPTPCFALAINVELGYGIRIPEDYTHCVAYRCGRYALTEVNIIPSQDSTVSSATSSASTTPPITPRTHYSASSASSPPPGEVPASKRRYETVPRARVAPDYATCLATAGCDAEDVSRAQMIRTLTRTSNTDLEVENLRVCQLVLHCTRQEVRSPFDLDPAGIRGSLASFLKDVLKLWQRKSECTSEERALLLRFHQLVKEKEPAVAAEMERTKRVRARMTPAERDASRGSDLYHGQCLLRRTLNTSLYPDGDSQLSDSDFRTMSSLSRQGQVLHFYRSKLGDGFLHCLPTTTIEAPKIGLGQDKIPDALNRSIYPTE